MKMKRILALLLAALMLLACLMGCTPAENEDPDGGDEGGAPATPDKTPDPRLQQPLLSSAHYKVTVAMMSYMLYSEYHNLVSAYENYSQQFGFSIPIYGGEGGDALNTKKGLREQNYATKDEKGNALSAPVTWFDHFAQLATFDVKEILAVCESANAKGLKLDAADEASLESTMKSLRDYAAYYGYETDEYVGAMYGEGVTEKDVRAMMELMYLANKYNQQRVTEITDAVTDEMIGKEYEDHNFGDEENRYDVFVDYISYEFVATFKPSANADADAAKAENEKKATEYEAVKARYKAFAEELKAAAEADPHSYEEKLLAILEELFFEQERDKALAAKAENDATLSDAEIAACRYSAAALAANAVVKANVQNVNTNASTTDVEFRDWVQDKETPRRAGDFFYDASDYDAFGNVAGGEGEGTAYKSATSCFTVYLLKSHLHRDESVTRSVGHILFMTDTYKDKTTLTGFTGPVKTLAERVLKRVGKLSAEEMAKELILLMQEEGKLTAHTEGDVTYYTVDKAVFEAYGKQYTEDGNVFYADVPKGRMVKPFEDWMFDESRVVGELSDGGVCTDFGYHVMMYCGDEKETFTQTIREFLAENTYNAWMEQIVGATTYTHGAEDLWDAIV